MVNNTICQFVSYLIVPTPSVSVTIQTNQTAGQSLTLYCNVTAVNGIISNVDIMWLVDGSELVTVRDINVFSTLNDMQIYMDSFTIEQLNVTDNEKVYQCNVLINSDPLVMASDNFTLNVTGKYVVSHVIMQYTSYVQTNLFLTSNDKSTYVVPVQFTA